MFCVRLLCPAAKCENTFKQTLKKFPILCQHSSAATHPASRVLPEPAPASSAAKHLYSEKTSMQCHQKQSQGEPQKINK